MDKHSQLLQKAAYYRGYVIHCTLHIEGYMEEIILDYFIKPDTQRILMKFSFFSTEFMTFEKKVVLLGILINNDYKEYNKKKSHLLAYLREIRDERNIMGHNMIAESDEYIKDFDGENVYFIITTTDSHVPKVSLLKYNEDTLDVFDRKFKICVDQLLELRDKIRRKRDDEGEGGGVSKP